MTIRSRGFRASTRRPGGHEWETPRKLFDAWHREFSFTVDAAALPHNARLLRFWTPEDDGLLTSWYGERVFANPPFGAEIGRWTRKAARETGGGSRLCPLAVLLVPVRSDTIWWHESVMGCAEIRFLKGRIRFELKGEASDPAPFPCCLLIYRGSEP